MQRKVWRSYAFGDGPGNCLESCLTARLSEQHVSGQLTRVRVKHAFPLPRELRKDRRRSAAISLWDDSSGANFQDQLPHVYDPSYHGLDVRLTKLNGIDKEGGRWRVTLTMAHVVVKDAGFRALHKVWYSHLFSLPFFLVLFISSSHLYRVNPLFLDFTTSITQAN